LPDSCIYKKNFWSKVMFKNKVINNLSSMERKESIDEQAERITLAFIDAAKCTLTPCR
jgi:hypothetical protein